MSYFAVILSVILAAAVTFVLTAIILRASRKRDLEAMAATDDAFGAAITQTEAAKGKSSDALGGLRGGAATAAGGGIEPAVMTEREIKNIVFACDAGMGSSAMGASVLRNKIKKAGIEDVTVVNKAIAALDGSADLVITQNQLTDRARHADAELGPRLGRQLHELAEVRRGRGTGPRPAPGWCSRQLRPLWSRAARRPRLHSLRLWSRHDARPQPASAASDRQRKATPWHVTS